MKTKTGLLAQLFSIIWILFAVAIYFVKFTSTSKSCHIWQGCFTFGSKGWKLAFQNSHSYIVDSFLTSMGSLNGGIHMPAPVYFILAGVLFVYLADYVYERFFEKKKVLDLKISPLSFLVIFALLFALIYNRWEAFYNLEAPIKYHGIFIRYPILILEFLSIFWVVLSIGRRIKGVVLKSVQKYDDLLREFILSSVFGISFLMLALYFMALFGLYSLKSVLVLFIVILLFCSKDTYFWLKQFFLKKISIKSKYFSPYVLLLLLILLFIAQNFLAILRPNPIGFDDLSVYMNNAHLMAEKGHLLSGVMSYYGELFTGLGYLFKNIPLAFMLSFFSSVLSMLVIFYLTNSYCIKRDLPQKLSRLYGVLAAAIFYTLPLVVFPSSQDMKVDFFGLFAALSSLLFFWEWKELYLAGKKNQINILILSAFLAGVGIAVKYTNLLFGLTLVIYLFYLVYRKNRFKLNGYKIIVLFLFMLVLPILPISVRNIYQTRSFQVADIRFGKAENQILIADPPFNPGDKIEPNFSKYMRQRRTGDKVEVGRYIGYDNGIKKYLLLPLRLTSNSLVFGPYLNTGYLFLAFIPLVLLLLIKHKKLSRKGIDYFYEVVIFGTIFWLGWLFSSPGIVWYGFAGFIFLLLVLIEVYHYIRSNFSWPIVLFSHIAVISWLIIALFLRFSYLPQQNIMTSPDILKYARGEITGDDVEKALFGRYLSVINEINKDIYSNPLNPPKVYRVGTFYKYFIAKNDETVCDDQLLDKFAYAYQDKDDKKLLERFKNMGFEYIIFDVSLKNVDNSPEQSLSKKYGEFKNFINNNSSNFVLLSDPYDEQTLILKIY